MTELWKIESQQNFIVSNIGAHVNGEFKNRNRNRKDQLKPIN